MLNPVRLSDQEFNLVQQYQNILEQSQQQMRTAQQQLEGALRMFMASRGLAGPWELVGKDLVPADLELLKAALQAKEADDLVSAERICRKLTAKENPNPDAFGLLAICLGFQEKNEEALEMLDRGLKLYPGSPELIHESAYHYLRLKRWQEGWECWEKRNWVNATKERMSPLLNVPEWDGSPLEGKTLMVITEGGIGDCVMFSRYLPLVNNPIMLLSHNRAFADLMLASGLVEYAYADKDEVPLISSCYVFMQSLPRLVCPDIIPAVEKTPFKWNKPHNKTLRVGIHWKGGGYAEAHKWRPSNLNDWAPILHTQGVEFVSLQLGEKPEYCVEGISDPSLLSTLKVISSLDLVICGDGIISHLAGFMGCPTWLLLHRRGFWPWETVKDDSEGTIWYPTIKRFTQTEAGWPELFQRVAKELEILLSGSPTLLGT